MNFNVKFQRSIYIYFLMLTIKVKAYV